MKSTAFAGLMAGVLTLGFCASADAALVRTIRYANFTTNSYVQKDVTAWCEPGEVATGGGHSITYGEKFFVYNNNPVANGSLQGWNFRFIIQGVYPQFTVVGAAYAVCVKEQ
ncbi:hypothetical protein J5226_10160 [Lysobacter sp. K5869]|uniref:hypothetical protein n=1 Tax=Lysobacter sp. K5869 TaxID=2820808 RepID=UPI001C05F372|nr:hypothetical protein [Lysobacter sp. K5869]QWP78727.1 hypothetical protein J5226_10160 [Lysobacter sp. K5869]